MSNNIWNTTPISESTKQGILAYIPHSKDDELRILDFGAGSGRYTKMFADAFPNAELYAVEVECSAIPQLKKITKNVLHQRAESHTLPYEDESFDYIFSSNVVEHIPHDIYLNYVSELHRILKPGGKLLLGAPNYPIKRLYDMKTVLYHILKRNFSIIKYYLFDDPTHINKLNVLDYEKDFSAYFSHVKLYPTEILFIKDPKKAYHLRKYGYKFFGECIK